MSSPSHAAWRYTYMARWCDGGTKLRLYRLCVCSSLTHCCEAWTLNRKVTRTINGFNSTCLHVITGDDYRVTATAPAYDLVLAVRKRRLRYIGHVLRLPADRMVRRALLVHVMGCRQYPAGSLSSDCADVSLPQLVTMASDRAMWRAKVASLSWHLRYRLPVLWCSSCML